MSDVMENLTQARRKSKADADFPSGPLPEGARSRKMDWQAVFPIEKPIVLEPDLLLSLRADEAFARELGGRK
jgi:hypothetical protein